MVHMLQSQSIHFRRASVTGIFRAIYIDPVAKIGGPIVPTDWKRYRDDTFNIEEDVEEQELSSFCRIFEFEYFGE